MSVDQISKKNIYELTHIELQYLTKELNIKPIHIKNLYTSVFRKLNKKLDLFNFPISFETIIKEKLSFHLPEISYKQISNDQKTIKFLIQLEDHLKVETVLVPFENKYTICISSQVGCAMKCDFCFTGKQGLKRNLKSYEIVAQYILAYEYIIEHFPNKSAPPNIVFMGQGEPLHNFENVKKAIAIFLEKDGLNLGPRQITLSTSGYLPGLKRFTELHNINLALSFHSPFNEERSKLIPINESYPIEDIFETLKTINLRKKQFINFEYLLIKDLNHSQSHIDSIVELLNDIPAIINVIPFNEFPGSEYKRPTEEQISTFIYNMRENNLHVMKRTTKGDDILAACGQLNTKN